MDTALGDAFVFLQGLEGRMTGASEYMLLEQSLSPPVRTRLQVRTCVPSTSTTLSVWSLAYRVGYQRRLATFMNAAGGRGDVYEVPEFEATGNSSVKMAPGSKAMCGLTRIQGDFRGSASTAQIRFDGSNWVLSTNGASSTMTARARCFARAQID
jgi:hypothetical protein